LPFLASRELGVPVRSELSAFSTALLPVFASAAFGGLLWSRSASGVYHFALVLPVTLLVAAVLLWRSAEPLEKGILRRLLLKVVPPRRQPGNSGWREA